jgi:hypothetical protein
MHLTVATRRLLVTLRETLHHFWAGTLRFVLKRLHQRIARGGNG